MGFWQTLFPDQAQAPIQATNVPVGVPQTPAVQPAPGQVAPQVQPTGPMQAQQAPAQVSPPPEKVAAWKGLIERIAQPDVLGPLQTFLAVAAAPMQPGETMGGRLAYAGTIMNLHRSMLEENARMQPYYEQKRKLELEKEGADIKRIGAATGASEAQTKHAEQQMAFESETRLQKLDELDQKIRAARTTGDLNALKIAEAERDALLDKKYGERGRKADIRLKEEQANYYTRIPKESGAESKKAKEWEKLSDEKFISSHKAEIIDDFARWVAMRRKAGEDDSFTKYLDDNQAAAKRQAAYMEEAARRGLGARTVDAMRGSGTSSAPQKIDTLDDVKARLKKQPVPQGNW